MRFIQARRLNHGGLFCVLADCCERTSRVLANFPSRLFWLKFPVEIRCRHCPGCERLVDLKNPDIDFCPHCGIGLFDHCHACQARKSAFAKFCHACGASGGQRSA